MAEADRIAKFKEVAVFLRRLEKAAGEHRIQRNQRVKVKSASYGGCRE